MAASEKEREHHIEVAQRLRSFENSRRPNHEALMSTKNCNSNVVYKEYHVVKTITKAEAEPVRTTPNRLRKPETKQKHKEKQALPALRRRWPLSGAGAEAAILVRTTKQSAILVGDLGP